MLETFFYNDIGDFYSLSFVDRGELDTIIVCPGPQITDNVRKRILQNVSMLKNSQNKIHVLTISRFIGEELKKFLPELEIVKKSELMLHLSIIWKKYFFDLPYETFSMAFNLLTELRSFTVDLELATEVLKEFDSNIAKAVVIFWKYLEEAEIIDEHASYARLLEPISRKSGKDVLTDRTTATRNIVFFGFQHLTAGQIDLLRALGRSDDVFVPFPKKVYRDTLPSDWIRWFNVDDDFKESDFEGSEESTDKRCQRVTFPKGRMAEFLKRYGAKLQKNDHVNVFLGIKNPEFEHINEVPLNNLYFKSPNDLFAGSILKLFEKLRGKQYFTRGGKCPTESFLVELEEMGRKQLLRPSLEKFRMIKVIDLLVDVTRKWYELSDENRLIGLFDLRVMEYIVGLNAPRTFASPLMGGLISGKIHGIEELDGFDPSNKQVLTIFCATSQHGFTKGYGGNHPEKVIEFLRAMGPIQRKELEYALIKDKIVDILSHENTVLFIENGLEKHGLAWNEILEGFDRIENIELERERPRRKETDYLGSFVERERKEKFQMVSATRLQHYLNCPRAYYYKYIDRISFALTLESQIFPRQLGIIQHRIIDNFFKDERMINNNRCFENGTFFSLAKRELDRFLEEREIRPEVFDYHRSLIEIADFARNGIEQLLVFLKLDPDTSYNFEHCFRDGNFEGRIDCTLKGSWGEGLLDFKRSKGSIPSEKEIFDFRSIQLLFYLLHSFRKGRFPDFFGFLNLSDPGESLIFAKDEQIREIILKTGFLTEKSVRIIKTPLEEVLDSYVGFERNLLKKIGEEQNYSPKPRNLSLCSYCQLANTCPRKEII